MRIIAYDLSTRYPEIPVLTLENLEDKTRRSKETVWLIECDCTSISSTSALISSQPIMPTASGKSVEDLKAIIIDLLQHPVNLAILNARITRLEGANSLEDLYPILASPLKQKEHTSVLESFQNVKVTILKDLDAYRKYQDEDKQS
ncbi:hypothetical protein T440DRAFT_483979 [Plenodomus tracheiphilus IPT5]|uniref:Uncharacterized protein n=1 Tax=Plenodomus tracheiphilus IPT5 TaxID=1408161 RepID=A0A6A7ANC6_9PLEO|nr:hypothetical protein T440DRAFT_483979 [Plenodomus tracheiphilus IPT5]